MKKAKYKTGGYDNHTTIKAGEEFKHVNPLDPSGRSDFIGQVIDSCHMKIIVPSVLQKMESGAADFWENHVSDIEPNWYLFRGLKVI